MVENKHANESSSNGTCASTVEKEDPFPLASVERTKIIDETQAIYDTIVGAYTLKEAHDIS